MTAALPSGHSHCGLPLRLPDAEDPLALSLNESPFAPLPTVRAAMVRAVDSVNRYPEFLPERFRRLIAKHLGFEDEQIIVGAGATGVVMQVLQALTCPGDRIVMAAPTFDGYPIFAQMARLQTVTVPLDEQGHHDLDAMADAATDAQVVVVCRPHNPTGTVAPAEDLERFLQRIGSAPWCCSTRHTSSSCRHDIASTPSSCCDGSRTSLSCAPSQKRTGGRHKDRVGICSPAMGRNCGRCSCRSGPPSPAWPRWRRRSTPKLNCVTGSGGSPQNATICARGSGRWASGALTPMPTSSICLRKGNFGPRRSTAPARGCDLFGRRRADHRRKPAVQQAVLAMIAAKVSGDGVMDPTLEQHRRVRRSRLDRQDRRVERRRGLLSATGQERQGIDACRSRGSGDAPLSRRVLPDIREFLKIRSSAFTPPVPPKSIEPVVGDGRAICSTARVTGRSV